MSEKPNVRIMPEQIMHPRYETEYSEYPDTLQVVMKNGHVRTYRLEVEQPHPQCMKAVDLIQLMQDNIYGGYKPKHAVTTK